MNRELIAFSLAVLLSFPIEGRAQREGEPEGKKHFDKEAFDAKFNAFIIAELGLTPEEAAAFLPLCGEYRQQKFESGRECRRSLRELRRETETEMSDSRYQQAIDCCVKADLQAAQLSKAYYERFKKVLPPAKLFKYREAEQRFIHRFLQRRE
ncbi:MAG: hypothetical protein LBT73_02390 [Tannerellaceae bacterium]|nr:hypothetical protein [Tannerellaceae bacterium]